MGLLAEHLLESRDVPGLGHAGFRLDANQPTQAVIAAEFAEHGLGGDVVGRPQDDDAPEDMHRVVVAAVAAGLAKRVE